MSSWRVSMSRIVLMPMLAAILLLFCGAATADIKKWIEPNGRVNYGDYPPVGAVVVPLSIQPVRTEPEQDASRPVNDPNADVPTPADAKRPLPGWSWKFGVRQ